MKVRFTASIIISAKETVQNILAFRFANYVFEPLWNNRFIEFIQISVAEAVSVGNEGGYYDSSGALRDMIQNHLLQLICIIAMECPTPISRKLSAMPRQTMQCVRIYTPADVFKNMVRGQYTTGGLMAKTQAGL